MATATNRALPTMPNLFPVPEHARVAGAFTLSPSGQLLFTPFGTYGAAYLVRTEEEGEALHRGMSRITILGLAIVLGPISLWIGRYFLSSATQWKIGLASLIAFFVWTAAFMIWARLVSSRLPRAERDGTIIGAAQAEDAAGAE